MIDFDGIVIFGCGNTAERFIGSYGDGVRIEYCLSNDERENVFIDGGKQYEVRRPIPKQKFKRTNLIVICSVDVENIAEQLEMLGYMPFVDFIDFEIAAALLSKKDIVLLYGFCHLRALRDALYCNDDIKNNYVAVYFSNYLFQNAYEQLKLGFLADYCSIFVYGQSVGTNEQRKNEAIIGRLPQYAEKISIPVIYFNGYFPQKDRPYNKMNKYAVKLDGYDYTPFSYEDNILNNWIDEGYETREIINMALNDIVIEEDYVIKALETEWKRIKFQERTSGVKIFEYLIDNYKKKRLFRNEAHMENDVFYHYASQILSKLGLRDSFQRSDVPFMRCSEHPIYPCVAKTIGVEWDVSGEQLELYTYKGWRRVGIEEYIEKYVESGKMIKKMQCEGILP